MPTGGTAGQVLEKIDGTDFNTQWTTPSTGVTDHGALTGLGDDDHTQYMLTGSGASNAIVPTYADSTGRNLQGSGVTMDASGNITTPGDIATLNGNILVYGTVDGRDVAADGSKLDGIEAGAEVNDPDTVLGPSSATDEGLAVFDGTTGKLVQDAGGPTVDTATGQLQVPNLLVSSAMTLGSGVGLTVGGSFTASSAATFNMGLVSIGNINVTGTVDGRDVAADGTKLDTVETNADVTDAANVEDAIADGMSGSSGFVSIRPGVGYNGGGASRQIVGGAGITVTHGSGAGGNPSIAADPQIIRLVVTTPGGGSGNIYLRSPGANNMGGGVASYGQLFLPQDCSLIRLHISFEVASYTSGNAEIDIQKRTAASGYTSTPWVLSSYDLAGPSSTADYRETIDFTPGTYTFSQGDCPIVKIDANDDGTMTLDDLTVEMYFLLDSRWEP